MPTSAAMAIAMTIATMPLISQLPSGTWSEATTTPARPETYPIDRSISPRSKTKTTPIAIAVTPAICVIRLVKFPAERYCEFFE